MAALETSKRSEGKRQERLAAWTDTLKSLASQIREWGEQEPGWKIEISETEPINEKHIGEYTACILTIRTPEGRLILEPVARNYPGRGVVELYAWPTLYRVRLLQPVAGGSWTVMTDSGIPMRQEWNRQNFVTLARDLATAP